VRQLLRQPRYANRSPSYQVIALAAVSAAWWPSLQPDEVVAAIQSLYELARERQPQLVATLDHGELPSSEWRSLLGELATEVHATAPDEAAAIS
ncbi:MAG: hypothetical protein KDA60_17070, partial [Planctomycetales bacterium]|nr:hypothetical protein [Planctomycetales bacterium]